MKVSNDLFSECIHLFIKSFKHSSIYHKSTLFPYAIVNNSQIYLLLYVENDLLSINLIYYHNNSIIEHNLSTITIDISSTYKLFQYLSNFYLLYRKNKSELYIQDIINNKDVCVIYLDDSFILQNIIQINNSTYLIQFVNDRNLFTWFELVVSNYDLLIKAVNEINIRNIDDNLFINLRNVDHLNHLSLSQDNILYLNYWNYNQTNNLYNNTIICDRNNIIYSYSSNKSIDKNLPYKPEKIEVMNNNYVIISSNCCLYIYEIESLNLLLEVSGVGFYLPGNYLHSLYIQIFTIGKTFIDSISNSYISNSNFESISDNCCYICLPSHSTKVLFSNDRSIGRHIVTELLINFLSNYLDVKGYLNIESNFSTKSNNISNNSTNSRTINTTNKRILLPNTLTNNKRILNSNHLNQTNNNYFNKIYKTLQLKHQELVDNYIDLYNYLTNQQILLNLLYCKINKISVCNLLNSFSYIFKYMQNIKISDDIEKSVSSLNPINRARDDIEIIGCLYVRFTHRIVLYICIRSMSSLPIFDIHICTYSNNKNLTNSIKNLSGKVIILLSNETTCLISQILINENDFSDLNIIISYKQLVMQSNMKSGTIDSDINFLIDKNIYRLCYELRHNIIKHNLTLNNNIISYLTDILSSVVTIDRICLSNDSNSRLGCLDLTNFDSDAVNNYIKTWKMKYSNISVYTYLQCYSLNLLEIPHTNELDGLIYRDRNSNYNFIQIINKMIDEKVIVFNDITNECDYIDIICQALSYNSIDKSTYHISQLHNRFDDINILTTSLHFTSYDTNDHSNSIKRYLDKLCNHVKCIPIINNTILTNMLNSLLISCLYILDEIKLLALLYRMNKCTDNISSRTIPELLTNKSNVNIIKLLFNKRCYCDDIIKQLVMFIDNYLN